MVVDGHNPLPEIYKNEAIVKEAIIKYTEIEPLIIHPLDDGTILVVFGQGINITSVIDRIAVLASRLDKSVTVECDMVMAEQFRAVMESNQEEIRIEWMTPVYSRDRSMAKIRILNSSIGGYGNVPKGLKVSPFSGEMNKEVLFEQ